MMALSELDQQWVRMTAKELTYQVTKEVLEEHIKQCPYGQRQINWKHLLIGIFIGAGILSSGGGLGLLIKSILGI